MSESEPLWKRKPPGQFALRHGGAPVVLARICHELRIASIVNAMVRWDRAQCRVSPGTLVVAIILNVLVDRKPLYQMDAFYTNRDLDLLFAEPVDVSMLNDDALGRALDRVAASDLPRLVQSVALCAVRTEQMEVRTVHADTTSVSVYGDFEPNPGDQRFVDDHPEAKLPEITHGYSKQKRPDLKQYTLGMVVSKDGLPLLGDIGDGNLSDKVWNLQVLKAISESFLDPRGIIYVADSSLMTKKNLRHLTDERIRFISRLPDNFATVTTAKKKAFNKDLWHVVGKLAQTTPKGAFYRTASLTECIDDTEYRLIVVRSSALDKRKQKKLKRTMTKERTDLTKSIKEAEDQAFNCKEDAQAALKTFLEKYENKLHQVKGEIVAHTQIKRPRGRPRKDAEYPKATTYHLRLRLFEPTDDDQKAWLDRESAFVLITNLPEDQYGDTEVLEEYKNQTKVEQGFHIYKHPIMAEGTLLKSVRRVQAFAYVAILALIAAAFLQYRVRQSLAGQRTTVKLRLQERRTDRPTSVALLKELHDIVMLEHITPDGERYRYFNREPTQDQIELLELAGYDPDIYIRPLTDR